MDKRGFVEIQFNWIFILIAGIVLLGFFLGVGNWIRYQSNRQMAMDILDKLGYIMTGAEVSEDSASLIKIPDSEMVFVCEGGPIDCNEIGCTSSYDFREYAGNPRDSSTDVIFSLSSLESPNLITWSLDWSMPYRIMNFLYVTTTDVRYVIVYSDATYGFSASVYDTLSNNKHISDNLVFTPKEDLKKVKYKNEDHLRLVFFEDPAGSPDYDLDSSLEDRDNVDYIIVDYQSGDNRLGKITFGAIENGQYKTETQNFPYFGMPTVIGAIFSGDLSMYKCNIKKGVNRLRHVNQLYWNLAKRYQDYYKNDIVCSGYYDAELISHFRYIDNITSLSNDAERFKPFIEAFNQPTELIDAINGIEQDNFELLQTSPSESTEKPCATIY
jgi:hypothetical protein